MQHRQRASNAAVGVDLIAQGFTAAELDASATFDASVWGASEFQSDTAEFKLQFLDGSGADVGAAFTTGEFGPNDGTWVEQTLNGNVPAGARPPQQHHCDHRHGRLDHLQWGWQFASSQQLNQAYVPFFGAFAAAIPAIRCLP